MSTNPSGTSPSPTPSLAVLAGDAFAAYQGGDRNRMGDLVRAATPVLWHTVRSYRLDTAAAEDVLQSTWLALVRRSDTIKDPRAVLQWLIVTARREAWRVSSAQNRVEPTDWEGEERVAPEQEQPEPSVLRSEQDRALWRHMTMLPERCQQLLRVIAFSEQPDYAEIARSLGMPVGSIGPTRGRCLAKLRASLSADVHWESS